MFQFPVHQFFLNGAQVNTYLFYNVRNNTHNICIGLAKGAPAAAKNVNLWIHTIHTEDLWASFSLCLQLFIKGFLPLVRRRFPHRTTRKAKEDLGELPVSTTQKDKIFKEGKPTSCSCFAPWGPGQFWVSRRKLRGQDTLTGHRAGGPTKSQRTQKPGSQHLRSVERKVDTKGERTNFP